MIKDLKKEINEVTLTILSMKEEEDKEDVVVFKNNNLKGDDASCRRWSSTPVLVQQTYRTCTT